MEENIKSLNILDYIKQADIDISTKVLHFIEKYGPFTVDKFLLLSSYEISNMRGVGYKTAKQIVSLQKYISLINGGNKPSLVRKKDFMGKAKHNDILEYLNHNDFNLSLSDKRLLELFRNNTLEEFAHLSFDDIKEITKKNERKIKRIVFFRDFILSSINNRNQKGINDEEFLSSDLLTYIDEKGIAISIRSRNVLKSNNIITIKDFLNLSSDDLAHFKNSGKKTVYELVNIQAFIKNGSNSTEKVTSLEKTKEDLLKHDDLEILNDKLLNHCSLSVRGANCLNNVKIITVRDFLELSEDNMMQIKNLGKNTRNELLVIQKEIIQSILLELDKSPSTWMEIVETNLDTITEYYWRGDIVLSDLNTDPFLKEYCIRKNIRSINTLLSTYVSISKKEDKIDEEDELLKQVTLILEKDEKSINEFISEKKKFIDNTKSVLIDYFKNNPFVPYSFDSLIEYLKDQNLFITHKELSNILNELIVKEIIHINDGKYRYTLYHFDSYLNDLPERERAILTLRLNGLSLEEIAHRLPGGYTRERIRQVQSKGIKKVKHKNLIKSQVPFFIEDYYADFYKKYDVPKALLIKQCGKGVFYYLKMMYKKGEAKFDYSASSDDIPKLFRRYLAAHISDYCINAYGELVPAKKGEIIKAILPHIKDEFSSEELIALYNKILETNGLNSTNKLWINDNSIRSWNNTLTDSKFTISLPGFKFRYYSFDSYDFDDFYNELNIQQYNGLVINANLLFTKNRKLMKRYNIHNKYELHNIMKKTYNKTLEIDFKRMPTLIIGNGNIELQIYEMIDKHGPINGTDLSRIAEKEYGFEPLIFLANYMKYLKKYKNGPFYQIDHVNMPNERKELLLNSLKEDFYFIKDIQSIYISLFGKNSVNECTPRNIESLGFKVNQATAIRNFNSVKDYYEHLMTKDDVFDMKLIPQKMYDSVLFKSQKIELESRYEIVRFDEYKYINIRKLRFAGIDVKDLNNFAEAVNNFVNNDCFNLYMIKKQGFNHPLFDLGFDNIFYSNILKYSGYFAYTAFRSDAIFKKKQNNLENLDNFYLITEELNKYSKIDVDMFIENINKIYNTTIVKGKWDTIAAAKRAGYYYSEVMNGFYKSKEDYYLDLEEGD